MTFVWISSHMFKTAKPIHCFSSGCDAQEITHHNGFHFQAGKANGKKQSWGITCQYLCPIWLVHVPGVQGFWGDEYVREKSKFDP